MPRRPKKGAGRTPAYAPNRRTAPRDNVACRRMLGSASPRGIGYTRPMIRLALCPPNPKLFDIAYCIERSRGSFGV